MTWGNADGRGSPRFLTGFPSVWGRCASHIRLPGASEFPHCGARAGGVTLSFLCICVLDKWGWDTSAAHMSCRIRVILLSILIHRLLVGWKAINNPQTVALIVISVEPSAYLQTWGLASRISPFADSLLLRTVRTFGSDFSATTCMSPNSQVPRGPDHCSKHNRLVESAAENKRFQSEKVSINTANDKWLWLSSLLIAPRQLLREFQRQSGNDYRELEIIQIRQKIYRTSNRTVRTDRSITSD